MSGCVMKVKVVITVVPNLAELSVRLLSIELRTVRYIPSTVMLAGEPLTSELFPRSRVSHVTFSRRVAPSVSLLTCSQVSGVSRQGPG